MVVLQGEWQTEAESTFQVIAVLQDRLESVRAQLLQEQSTVEQLQVDLQSSVGEIQHWKEQRRQEADKLQQVHTIYPEILAVKKFADFTPNRAF